jgi:hypothetical protein
LVNGFTPFFAALAGFFFTFMLMTPASLNFPFAFSCAAASAMYASTHSLTCFDFKPVFSPTEEYAPDAVIGDVGSGGGGGAKKKKEKKPKKGAKPVVVDKGDKIANHQAWGHLDGRENWREGVMDSNPGVFLINVRAYFYAAWYLLSAVLYEVAATIFVNKNFKITGDRVGLTRSAILLVLFIVIHAVGNLHVFKGPDDFNGYGYFYVRLYWTGFGLPANIVEEYILLSVLLHVLAGLKRTWDTSLGMFKNNPRALDLACTGLVLLTFMTVHLFQFRFGNTDQFGPYMIRPPPYLINLGCIRARSLLDEGCLDRAGGGSRHLRARVQALQRFHCLEPLLHIRGRRVHGPRLPRLEEARPCLGLRHPEEAHPAGDQVRLRNLHCGRPRLHLLPDVLPPHGPICRLREGHQPRPH